MIHKIVIATLISFSVGLAANIADPASRSGVWEATEVIDGITVHFQLRVEIRTNARQKDGSFELRDVSAVLESTGTSGSSGATRSTAPFQAGLQLLCDLAGNTAEMTDDRLAGPCGGRTKWDRIEGTFGWKGETVSLLLIGESGDVNILFRRLPIDSRSTLGGDWQGTRDLIPRQNILHFRTSVDGGQILTLDGWNAREGSWGLMLQGGFSADDQTVSFSNGQQISHSSFQATLSPDKQQFTGTYSGGQFAANTFVRIAK